MSALAQNNNYGEEDLHEEEEKERQEQEWLRSLTEFNREYHSGMLAHILCAKDIPEDHMKEHISHEHCEPRMLTEEEQKDIFGKNLVQICSNCKIQERELTEEDEKKANTGWDFYLLDGGLHAFGDICYRLKRFNEMRHILKWFEYKYQFDSFLAGAFTYLEEQEEGAEVLLNKVFDLLPQNYVFKNFFFDDYEGDVNTALKKLQGH